MPRLTRACSVSARTARPAEPRCAYSLRPLLSSACSMLRPGRAIQPLLVDRLIISSRSAPRFCGSIAPRQIQENNMRYLPLGRTGLFVSELCLGTMTFGGSGESMWAKIGELQQSEAERLVGQALDAGINFIDTANVYAGGVSEQITGQALKNLKIAREDVIVATKTFGEAGKAAKA